MNKCVIDNDLRKLTANHILDLLATKTALINAYIHVYIQQHEFSSFTHFYIQDERQIEARQIKNGCVESSIEMPVKDYITSLGEAMEIFEKFFPNYVIEMVYSPLQHTRKVTFHFADGSLSGEDTCSFPLLIMTVLFTHIASMAKFGPEPKSSLLKKIIEKEKRLLNEKTNFAKAT